MVVPSNDREAREAFGNKGTIVAAVNRLKEQELSLARLRHVLCYDAETGKFFWRFGNGNNRLAGDVAGSHQREKSGAIKYQLIRIDGMSFLGHRLAWFYVHGEWPSAEVDHINGVKSDNRIANLRDVSRQHNSWNISVPRCDNAAGIRHIHPKGNKFQVVFCAGNRRIYHRSHPTLEAALAARKRVASALRGQFAAPEYRSQPQCR